MIRKIGIFMVTACPCVLGYYWYTNFTEPVLLFVAAFFLVFGLFSMTIKSPKKNKSSHQLEMEKKLKMFFFFFMTIILMMVSAITMGGENLGKINYWPISCWALACMSMWKGQGYKKSNL